MSCGYSSHFLTKVVIEIFGSDHSWALHNRLLIRHMSLVCCVDYWCTSTQSVNCKQVMRSMTREGNVEGSALLQVRDSSLVKSLVVEENMPPFMIIFQHFLESRR